MSVYEVSLADCLHPIRPPEKVLRLAAVGDTAFLSIERYDEDARSRKGEIIEQIAVSLPAIREALQLLRHDEEREAMRPDDGEQGDKAASLKGGPRLSVLPL